MFLNKVNVGIHLQEIIQKIILPTSVRSWHLLDKRSVLIP